MRPPQRQKPKKDAKPRGGFYAGPGDYYVSVMVDQDTSSQWLNIAPDPRLSITDSEIIAKQKQINNYNQLLERATAIADEVRDEASKMKLQKEVLLLTMDKDDPLFVALDSVSRDLSDFRQVLLGKDDVQGIYRDPALMSSMIRSVGSAIDHPLSPVTSNQETQLSQLEKLIDSKKKEWMMIKTQCRDQVEQLMKGVKMNLWDE